MIGWRNSLDRRDVSSKSNLHAWVQYFDLKSLMTYRLFGNNAFAIAIVAKTEMEGGWDVVANSAGPVLHVGGGHCKNHTSIEGFICNFTKA